MKLLTFTPKLPAQPEIYCERCTGDEGCEYVDEYGRFLCSECRGWFYQMLDRADDFGKGYD